MAWVAKKFQLRLVPRLDRRVPLGPASEESDAGLGIPRKDTERADVTVCFELSSGRVRRESKTATAARQILRG